MCRRAYCFDARKGMSSHQKVTIILQRAAPSDSRQHAFFGYIATPKVSSLASLQPSEYYTERISLLDSFFEFFINLVNFIFLFLMNRISPNSFSCVLILIYRTDQKNRYPGRFDGETRISRGVTTVLARQQSPRTVRFWVFLSDFLLFSRQVLQEFRES